MSGSEDPWERHATWWRETFTNGADLEYELQILPLAVSHLEGTSRRLARGTGKRSIVVGLEPSAAQLAGAVGGETRAPKGSGATRAGRRAGPRYVRGAGEELPFRDGSFDAVVCCLVIEHVLDPDALLAEAVRVLAVGGRFILLVNHPMFQGTGSGFVDDQILGEHYWRVGPYLHEDVALEEVDPGVRLRFAHRPLSRYVNPVTALGCVLTRLEEPEPPLAFLEGSVDLELESAIPRLLLMRFERLRT
jgi:SAM-dependent methyltransferase